MVLTSSSLLISPERRCCAGGTAERRVYCDLERGLEIICLVSRDPRSTTTSKLPGGATRMTKRQSCAVSTFLRHDPASGSVLDAGTAYSRWGNNGGAYSRRLQKRLDGLQVLDREHHTFSTRVGHRRDVRGCSWSLD